MDDKGKRSVLTGESGGRVRCYWSLLPGRRLLYCNIGDGEAVFEMLVGEQTRKALPHDDIGMRLREVSDKGSHKDCARQSPCKHPGEDRGFGCDSSRSDVRHRVAPSFRRG